MLLFVADDDNGDTGANRSATSLLLIELLDNDTLLFSRFLLVALLSSPTNESKCSKKDKRQ